MDNRNHGEGASQSDRPRLVLEYIQALAWPVVIIGVLVFYQPPLGQIVESLAAKLDTADKVSLGSFTLEVAERAREVGNPELAEEIGELSAPAVEALMQTPRIGSMVLLSKNDWNEEVEYGLPRKEMIDGLLQLEQKGFVEFDEPLADFLAYLESLPRRERPSHYDRDQNWFVPEGNVDTLRLNRQGYRLTERGFEAAEAITKAVAAQLAP